MKETYATTHRVQLHIAGDAERIRQIVNDYCRDIGLCVTIRKQWFVYTGGEERGVVIGLVNYPRFPTTADELEARARHLATCLLEQMNQRSCLLVAGDRTTWMQSEIGEAK